MFTKEIHDMTLTNDIANRLFDNITAQEFLTDQSFKATLRAVLHKRLSTKKSLNLTLVPLYYDTVTPDVIVSNIYRNDIGSNYSIYIVYPQDKQFGEQTLDIVRANFGKGKQYFNEYTLTEDLRIFYIKMLNGLFYISDNNTIIFLDSIDLRKFHALQMMIPKYLPHLFEEMHLTDDETALLKSLGGRSHFEYERLIEHFAKQFDMRSEMIKTRLKNFEHVFEREKAYETSRLIESNQREYRLLLDKLRTVSNNIDTHKITLAGLQCRLDADIEESELMEYFLCNKQLSIIKVKDTMLEFVVHGYADVYDEDALDTYVNNQNSFLYKKLSSSVTKEEMECLYKAIFSNGEYKLCICAAYRADMKNSLTPIMDYIFPPESKNHMPNPHIQKFGCIGGYYSRFMDYMNNRDYVGAIDQAVVSARNLNFHDSVVMTQFAYILSNTTSKCIEDLDGNFMTPKDAIKKLMGVVECQSQS